jgi:hypothetical protein
LNKTTHIILLAPGLWLTSTGTTMTRQNATSFHTKDAAESALTTARRHRPYLLAEVKRAGRPPMKTAYTGEWELTEEELERRKAEVREDREKQGGAVQTYTPGIHETRMDRRRNGRLM